jgi:hypothetical protein
MEARDRLFSRNELVSVSSRRVRSPILAARLVRPCVMESAETRISLVEYIYG